MSKAPVHVSAPSRVHLGLLQMSEAYSVRHMGLGFALTSPAWRFRCEPAKTITVTGNISAEMATVAQAVASSAINTLSGEGVAIAVESCIPAHVGLGSKTALTCAVVAGCAAVVGNREWWRHRDLTGRGGTSGIGINTAVTGGFVLDGGHEVTVRHTRFRPSSVMKPTAAPPVVARWPAPSWGFVVLLPLGVRHFFGREEEAVFDRYLPLPPTEAERVAGIVLYEILPALSTGNYEAFTSAVEQFQAFGFKRVEWEIQDSDVQRVRDEVRSLGADCVALSSMGPCMAVFARDVDAVAVHFAGRPDVSIIRANISNTGIEISRC